MLPKSRVSASSVGVSCQIPILTTRVRVPAGALTFCNSSFCNLFIYSHSNNRIKPRFLIFFYWNKTETVRIYNQRKELPTCKDHKTYPHTLLLSHNTPISSLQKHLIPSCPPASSKIKMAKYKQKPNDSGKSNSIFKKKVVLYFVTLTLDF